MEHKNDGISHTDQASTSQAVDEQGQYMTRFFRLFNTVMDLK